MRASCHLFFSLAYIFMKAAVTLLSYNVRLGPYSFALQARLQAVDKISLTKPIDLPI